MKYSHAMSRRKRQPALSPIPLHMEAEHASASASASQAPKSSVSARAGYGSWSFAQMPVSRVQSQSGTSQSSATPVERVTSDTKASSLSAKHALHQENQTGLPDRVKAGVEHLSGFSLDDVQVHYNSAKPVQVDALAYTQGTQIHVGPGQEKHLGHEAWHVVQQKQGRVKPTIQTKGRAINNNRALEKEADVMGARAWQVISQEKLAKNSSFPGSHEMTPSVSVQQPLQRVGVNATSSDPALMAAYQYLERNSATFKSLSDLITSETPIILLDSSSIPGQPTDYDPTTHTIRVPLNNTTGVARPMADVRDDILWEMHNASAKGSHTRTDLMLPVPDLNNASLEEKKQYPYIMAAKALSIEWDEWINIAEHDLRVVKINNELVGGATITRAFQPYFATPDQGWYNFEDYLSVQITTGHTSFYDGYAAQKDWVGKKIVNIARSKTTAPLKLTQQQVTDWQNEKRKKMKSPDNNPFKSKAIVEEASRGQ